MCDGMGKLADTTLYGSCTLTLYHLVSPFICFIMLILIPFIRPCFIRSRLSFTFTLVNRQDQSDDFKPRVLECWWSADRTQSCYHK